MSSPFHYLVTVDRDCRKIFWVNGETREVRVVTELEQRMERSLENELTADARAWNRGLKTIRLVPEGYVICDIFGIYLLNHQFEITRYLSIPQFTDLHSAIPSGDLLVVSNTGVDQVLWVTWEGQIVRSIDLHRWFPATPWMAHDLALVRERSGGDLRKMPLDWARESCHVNWAEETPVGTILACFIQGDIFIFREGRPVWRVPASAKLHAPQYLEATGTFLFSASEENRIVEVDREGRELWSMSGFRFAKYAAPLPGGRLIIADTGNQRIAEVNRERKEIVWECPIEGTPYDVQTFDPSTLKRGER